MTVSCAYLTGGEYWRDDLEDMGVRVTALRAAYHGDPFAFIRLWNLIDNTCPDIVHVHGAPVELYILPIRLANKFRTLLVTRHEPRRRLFKLPGYSLIDRAISRYTDQIISVSQSVMDEDVQRRPELAAKDQVIHHGIDSNFTQAATAEDARRVRLELGISEGELLIGTVARHTSEKSIDTLLKAFRRCLDTMGEQTMLRLALIGRGPLTGELKKLASDLKIDGQVSWCSSREDMPAVMRAFDIFALPSREEGFGIVLLEAMISERPVVACNVDAIPEVVVHGETGFVVPPCDDAAFAAALQDLACNPELRARFGEYGRERVKAKFTLDKVHQKTTLVYATALASRL